MKTTEYLQLDKYQKQCGYSILDDNGNGIFRIHWASGNLWRDGIIKDNKVISFNCYTLHGHQFEKNCTDKMMCKDIDELLKGSGTIIHE